MSTKAHYRIAISFFFFLQGLVYASWAGRIPDIKASLGFSEGTFGMALLALPTGQLAAMALSGYLVTRFGSRIVMALGAVLYPLALINLSLADNLWQFVLFGIMFGMCGNLSNISLNTQGVGVERLYNSSIMAGFHGMWSVASFVGAMVSLLMVEWGFSPTRHFLLVLATGVLILLALYRSTLPRDQKIKAAENTDEEGKKEKSSAFFSRYILILGIIGMSGMMCEGAMFNWNGIYYESIIKPDEQWIRLGLIAFTFFSACGRFMADRFVTKYGVVRILQACGLTILLGLLLIVLYPSMIFSTIGSALAGLGTSAVVPIAYSMAGRAKTIAPGIAIAGVSSISFLGFLIGPPAIGLIAEASNLRVSIGLIAVTGVTIALLASRSRGK